MRGERVAGALAYLSYAAVAALAGALLLYAHPQIDDLARAARVREWGIATSIGIEYATWSGRWLGTGISYAVSRFFDLRQHYALALGLIPVVYLLALYGLIRALLTTELLAPSGGGTEELALPRRQSLGFAASLLVLLWVQLGTPGEAFYWLTGALENQLGIALPVALVAWLLRMPARTGLSPSRWTRLVAIAALSVALPAFHELYGSILLLALVAGALLSFAPRDAKRVEWTVAAIACVLGLAIVAVAPGNRVRMEDDPAARSADVVLRLLLHQALPLLGRWLLAPTLLAATLAFVLHPAVCRLRPSWLVPGVWNWNWWIPLSTLAIELYILVACYWLRGRPVTPRTEAGMSMFFLLGWFATAFAWTRGSQPEGPSRVPRAAVRSVSLLVLAAALLLSQNAWDAWSDLGCRAPAYDAALRERDAFIAGALENGDGFVSVPPLPTEPVLFMHADLLNNPRDYRNLHYARFYKLRSLRLNGDPSADEPLLCVAHAAHPARVSLLEADASGLGDLEGPLPEWRLTGQARRMIGPKAQIDFVAPPGSVSCALELRALSTVPGQSLEVRANGTRILLHRFRAVGEWHDILSSAFLPRSGPNRLVLRAGSAAREEGQDLVALLGGILLKTE
jgi:hypothetical protein